MSAPRARSRFLGVTMPSGSPGSVGKVLFNRAAPGRPTQIHVVTTPEGVLGVATCRACGGRHEHLMDCRARSTDPGATTAALWQVLTSWVMEHECPAETLPESVLDAADAAVDRVVSDLAQGIDDRPEAVLVMPGGDRVALLLPDLSRFPHRQLDELYARIAYQLRQTQVLETRRAIGLVLVRLVPPSLPGRLPHLSVTCASRHIAIAGRVPVRLHGVGGPYPDGEWDWEPVAGPHRCIDGVLTKAVMAKRRR